jgi:hypothetical protein
MLYIYVVVGLRRLFIADGKDIFSILLGSVKLMRVFFPRNWQLNNDNIS